MAILVCYVINMWHILLSYKFCYFARARAGAGYNSTACFSFLFSNQAIRKLTWHLLELAYITLLYLPLQHGNNSC